MQALQTELETTAKALKTSQAELETKAKALVELQADTKRKSTQIKQLEGQIKQQDTQLKQAETQKQQDQQDSQALRAGRTDFWLSSVRFACPYCVFCSIVMFDVSCDETRL